MLLHGAGVALQKSGVVAVEAKIIVVQFAFARLIKNVIRLLRLIQRDIIAHQGGIDIHIERLQLQRRFFLLDRFG